MTTTTDILADLVTLTLPRARMTEIAWAVQEAAAMRAEEASDGGHNNEDTKENEDMAEIFEARLVDIERVLER